MDFRKWEEAIVPRWEVSRQVTPVVSTATRNISHFSV